MDYKGIKINDKIIIVEKPYKTTIHTTWKERTINQGYVVDVDNKNSLESALNWAINKYHYPKREDYNNEASYLEDKAKCDKVIHTYDNGKFEITLSEAADKSWSQGGKLSFWNCIIKAPDGKEFLVGINSELLLHLLCSNTLVNGTCQNKVWLGRVKGTQVGAFSENMEEFAQAKKDATLRKMVKQKATDKYVPGDVLETLTTKSVYLGTGYVYFQVYGDGYRREKICFYDKPKLVHIYQIYCKHNDGTYYDFNCGYYDTQCNKVKRTITGHIELEKTGVQAIYDYNNAEIDRILRDNVVLCNAWYHMRENLKYGSSPECNKEEIINQLRENYSQTHKAIKFDDVYKIITEKEYKEKYD